MTIKFGYTVSSADEDLKVATVIIPFDGNFQPSASKHDLVNQLKIFHENGWRLLQIFEDETLNRDKIVESRVAHTLGQSKKILYARKCKLVRNISSKEIRDFFNNNHIQGAGRGINLTSGLYYEGVLVALAGIGKARFSTSIDYELIRLASLTGHSVVGGASRIMKDLLSQIPGKSLISYADKRYSDGNLYRKLGFIEGIDSSPCYWYYKIENKSKKYHRSAFQKHKLPKLLEIFDINKTEIENMKINGWSRIFDAGNYIFTLKQDVVSY